MHTSLTKSATVGSVIVPANPLQIPRLMDSEPRIPDGGFRIVDNTLHRYKTVRIEGAPIVVMFSAGYYDGTLDEDWSAADETAYKVAASGASGYSTLSFVQQAALNDEYRRGRPGLDSVYLRHRIDPLWSWRAGRYAPYGGQTRHPIVPFVDGNGNVDWGHMPTVTPLLGQKTLLDWLPIRHGSDYTTSPPTESGTAEDQYERPLLWCRATRNGRDWRFFELGDLPPAYPRTALHMLGGVLGFELRPAAAAPHRFGLRRDPHLEYGSWFDVDAAEPTMQPPTPADSLDYRELVITAAVELDVRPYVEFSPNVFVDNDETLIVRLPWVHYHAATAQAIVGLTTSAYDTFVSPAYVHADERLLRDDTAELRAVAVFAKQWFSEQRRLIDVTIRRLEHFPIGALLLTVTYGGRLNQVNTVISGVHWDFRARTTRVTTSHREIAFARLFGGQSLGMSRGESRATIRPLTIDVPAEQPLPPLPPDDNLPGPRMLAL